MKNKGKRIKQVENRVMGLEDREAQVEGLTIRVEAFDDRVRALEKDLNERRNPSGVGHQPTSQR